MKRECEGRSVQTQEPGAKSGYRGKAWHCPSPKLGTIGQAWSYLRAYFFPIDDSRKSVSGGSVAFIADSYLDSMVLCNRLMRGLSRTGLG